MRLQGEIRLLKVPFFVRSSRLSGHRRARPSWFQMHRGGGPRATLGTFETKMAARNGRCSIPTILPPTKIWTVTVCGEIGLADVNRPFPQSGSVSNTVK